MQKIGKSYIEEELVTTLLGVAVITQSPKESFLKRRFSTQLEGANYQEKSLREVQKRSHSYLNMIFVLILELTQLQLPIGVDGVASSTNAATQFFGYQKPSNVKFVTSKCVSSNVFCTKSTKEKPFLKKELMSEEFGFEHLKASCVVKY